MIIGYLALDIYLPGSHSLKEKRKQLSSFRDRLKSKYNVAFAELDYQDKWQRSKLGIITINSKKHMVEQILHTIVREAEERIEGEILHKDMDFY
jgi:uncharacterized protein